jgi:hypothetical protein
MQVIGGSKNSSGKTMAPLLWLGLPLVQWPSFSPCHLSHRSWCSECKRPFPNMMKRLIINGLLWKLHAIIKEKDPI